MAETALITGASSGIGEALAREFAAHGFNLLLVARREERLRKLADELGGEGRTVTVIPKDLADPAAADDIFREVHDRDIRIDVLVNNAGTQVYGKFQETDIEAQLALLRVNLMNLTALTGLFLPEMVERGEGRVLNLASVGSFMPVPLNAAYCASKAYILNFSEGIGRDLKGTGVTVTALCPGATASEFAERAGMADSRFFAHAMSCEQVAKAGYAGVMNRTRVVVPGLLNKLTVFSMRLTPRKLATDIGFFLMGKTG